jgi:hypothetical protein
MAVFEQLGEIRLENLGDSSLIGTKLLGLNLSEVLVTILFHLLKASRPSWTDRRFIKQIISCFERIAIMIRVFI